VRLTARCRDRALKSPPFLSREINDSVELNRSPFSRVVRSAISVERLAVIATGIAARFVRREIGDFSRARSWRTGIQPVLARREIGDFSRGLAARCCDRGLESRVARSATQFPFPTSPRGHWRVRRIQTRARRAHSRRAERIGDFEINAHMRRGDCDLYLISPIFSRDRQIT
jgi:hypothetical protein